MSAPDRAAVAQGSDSDIGLSASAAPARGWHARHSAGLGLLLVLVAVAALGGALSGHDPVSQDLNQVREAPGMTHWLGTDHLGRDQLARLAAALRSSLGFSLSTVTVAAILGCGLGLLAAWRGGAVERLCVMLADAVLALPGLLLVLLIAAIAPGDHGPLYAGMALVMWVEYFRLVRAMARSVLAGAPVEAARLLGFGPGYLVRHHLVPVLLPVVSTLMCFGASSAVLAMAALGFVGVGLQPPEAELGLMLIELLPYCEEAPWLLAAPMLCLLLLTTSLVLLAGRDMPLEDRR